MKYYELHFEYYNNIIKNRLKFKYPIKIII